MKKVKVILLKDVTNLGKKGDIIDVSFGFYMNYLERNNLAKRASEGEERDYELRKSIKIEKESKEEARAKELKEKIEKELFTIKRKAGDKGKLYGSVTNEDIALILKEKIGVTFDKKKIEIDEPIKTLGYHEAKLKLYKNIHAKIKINITEE